ncbi:MAG: lipoate--protein ligase family protein [Cyanobacteria bacterium P01_E01_bin.45]
MENRYSIEIDFSNARPYHSMPLDILPFTVASGDQQMTRDRELCNRVFERVVSAPILRFYQWTRPTLSLGYHQKTESLPAIPEHLTRALDVVRRPTGGRAVLHQASGPDADLTYCIVAHDLGMNRRQAYTYLCQFLIDGLQRLGVTADFGDGGRGYIGEASCFRTATSADVCWRGKKLVGSAQLWRKQTVLQHGTILLDPDRTLWETVLPGSSQQVIGLNEILIQSVEVEEAIAAFSQAATQWFTQSPPPIYAR